MESSGASTTGGVFVLHGPVSGELSPSDADLTFTAESYGSGLGDYCANLGDTNLDGYDDFIVGSDQAGDGAAYIVWGSPTLSDMPIANADVIFRGDHAARFGYITESAGDLNEDGWNEVIIGDAAGSDRENVYVFYGPFTASSTTYASAADITLNGDGDGDNYYQSLITKHDVTGDGVTDVLVGSHGHKITSYSDGIFYIVPGIGF
jgi:hypothetical protein